MGTADVRIGMCWHSIAPKKVQPCLSYFAIFREAMQRYVFFLASSNRTLFRFSLAHRKIVYSCSLCNIASYSLFSLFILARSGVGEQYHLVGEGICKTPIPNVIGLLLLDVKKCRKQNAYLGLYDFGVIIVDLKPSQSHS